MANVGVGVLVVAANKSSEHFGGDMTDHLAALMVIPIGMVPIGVITLFVWWMRA